jgi:hypothetical protein
MRHIGITLIIFLLSTNILPARDTDSTLVFETITRRSNTLLKFTNFGGLATSFGSLTATNLWPRDSMTNYLFSGGFAFVCQKKNSDGIYNKMAEISFNVNTASDGHFVPGCINDGDLPDYDSPERFMAFSSLNHNPQTGAPQSTRAMNQKWPLWKTGEIQENFPGLYVFDENLRNPNDYLAGPSIISDEDIFCVYKDTDLSQRDLPGDLLRSRGYPLQLQIEQTAFTWDNEPYKDIIVILYKAINYSTDTLERCWFAPMFDPDIAPGEMIFMGSGNDRVATNHIPWQSADIKYSACFTDTSSVESGYHFGYLGISYLMRPAVDASGRLRNGKAFYGYDEQQESSHGRYIPLALDISDENELYDFVSSGEGNSEYGPADIRVAFASGPFDMAPGDTMKAAVMLAWAFPSFYEIATGDKEDLVYLEEKISGGYDLFYNNIISGKKDVSPEKDIIIGYPSPNPAWHEVGIEIRTPYNAHSEFAVYTSEGKNTGIGCEKYLHKGANFINLNISNLASAAYILLIKINGRTYYRIIHKTG